MSGVPANILVIESSSPMMRISLLKKDGSIKSFENTDRFSHAENILPLIERVMTDGGVKKEELGGIVISKGPGSFTGLRIGMATAKGLAISLGCPLAAVSVFEAAGVRLPGISRTTAMLVPSRRDEYYLGLVNEKPFDESGIRVVRGEELQDGIGKAKIFAPDIDHELLPFPKRQIINKDRYSLEPQDYIEVGRAILKSGGDDLEKLEPLYIQPFPAIKQP